MWQTSPKLNENWKSIGDNSFWRRLIEPYYINYGELNIVKNKIDKIIPTIEKKNDTTAKLEYYLFH